MSDDSTAVTTRAILIEIARVLNHVKRFGQISNTEDKNVLVDNCLPIIQGALREIATDIEHDFFCPHCEGEIDVSEFELIKPNESGD